MRTDRPCADAANMSIAQCRKVKRVNSRHHPRHLIRRIGLDLELTSALIPTPPAAILHSLRVRTRNFRQR